MSEKKQLHLICNSHIDPVWLWEWPEGLAEALSTFRTAARFCDEFPDFIFNHNESILYQWVEKIEPELFARIGKHVKNGRWHIMGGWYLQPDCNIPSGEALVRQILQGKLYFKDRFAVDVKTAINFDPFGHSRGLVQILAKSGYDSYIFCRPDAEFLQLPADDFVWEGYDGSRIIAHRAGDHYNSRLGQAAAKVDQWLIDRRETEVGLLLWGIGNHGGGPSASDLQQLQEVISGNRDREVCHSTPENYFFRLKAANPRLPVYSKDLNPWAVGCYSSMSRVKRGYRQCENLFFLTEKIVTHAALLGLAEYPNQDLNEAREDMLLVQFHDILPGSSIQDVENYALRKLGHATDILDRLKVETFFSLLSGQPEAAAGEFPLFIFNPHPYPINGIFEFEFQPPEPNFNPETFWLAQLFEVDGTAVPSQHEMERCNIAADQRKRLVFSHRLDPMSLKRLSCRIRDIPAGESVNGAETTGFRNESLDILVNPNNGLLSHYRLNGIDFINDLAGRLDVFADDADPWGMRVRAFSETAGCFELMDTRESAVFAGCQHDSLPPVRVIEDGPVRLVVESLFKYNHSSLCLQTILPKDPRHPVEMVYRIYWLERDKLVKLHLPSPFKKGRCLGQVAYGVEDYSRPGEELLAQKWIALVSADNSQALTVINDGSYGFDFENGRAGITLLRAPAYAGHPVDEKTPIVAQDRFRSRLDQGEHLFRFWLQGGPARERLERIDREAQVRNEAVLLLPCSPSGEGDLPGAGLALSDPSITLSAFKMSEAGDRLIIRLFNPTGGKRSTGIRLSLLGLDFKAELGGYEIKSYAVNPKSGQIYEVDLLENAID